MKRRHKVILSAVVVLLALFYASLVYVELVRAQRADSATHSHSGAVRVVPVCVDTGLTGAAQQENGLFCSTNILTGVTTNGAGSVYQAAIHIAAAKHIVVGTPTSVVQTVDWVGIPITYVTFTNGSFHAEHYNPSDGHVR